MFEPKDYLTNKTLSPDALRYHPDIGGKPQRIDPRLMVVAAAKANKDFEKQIKRFKAWADEGMVVLWDGVLEKNKSGAFGECLAAAYCALSKTSLVKNPHESASPDFIPLFEGTASYIEKPTEKTYLGGGFDAKASKMSDFKFMSIKASSHHRLTTTVLVVGWGYFKGMPKILSACFCNNLVQEDWKIGSIPKGDDSKPTSSATLLKSGLDKIRSGWVFVHQSVVLPNRKNDIEKYGINALAVRATA